MQNDNFNYEEVDAMRDNEASYETEWRQEQWIMLAGGLSVLFAAVAGVLILLLRRRRPTRVQRAEAALIAAAERAESAARTVRKQGPPILRRSVQRTEQAVEYTRGVGQGIAGQTSGAVARTREVGGSVVAGAQDLVGRVQKRINH